MFSKAIFYTCFLEACCGFTIEIRIYGFIGNNFANTTFVFIKLTNY
jgi:hypothetical protein